MAEAPIEVLSKAELDEVRPLLLDLLVEDQDRYGPRTTPRELIDRDLLGRIASSFTGENVILAIRDDAEVVALCWCVIFDPGTGLEGEVAEVYVRPDHRGQGLARRLLARAVDLFRERQVTFAAVWTHGSNAAAIRLYRSAGFEPTEQLVLTWLPKED
ncbi:MAG: GNAT family N-acetyltransferase [Candidatus Dormiibacterota bacterium]